jgi:deoxyribose-phosphate aldolase
MNIASYIDHTILRADCNSEDIKRICAEAVQYKFKSVCVPPYFVKEAAGHLENSPVKVVTVIGFPMGYSTTPSKVEEIKRAIDDGAHEVDVVVNLCAIKSGNWNYVGNDIDSMTTAVHIKGKVIKVILETGLLDEAEIRRLCRLCEDSKVDFVKTSTGFNGEGANIQVLNLLKSSLSSKVKIKASGGIRTREDALRLIEAGANRIGTSSGVLIVSGKQ